MLEGLAGASLDELRRKLPTRYWVLAMLSLMGKSTREIAAAVGYAGPAPVLKRVWAGEPASGLCCRSSTCSKRGRSGPRPNRPPPTAHSVRSTCWWSKTMWTRGTRSRSCFHEQGSRVRAAASVREALEAYGARPPDVIISDVGMPGESGYALIREIRDREEGGTDRTLAIAITGFAGRQDHEMALRAGFDDHVAKPVEPDELLNRLRVLAASRPETGGGRT